KPCFTPSESLFSISISSRLSDSGLKNTTSLLFEPTPRIYLKFLEETKMAWPTKRGISSPWGFFSLKEDRTRGFSFFGWREKRSRKESMTGLYHSKIECQTEQIKVV